MLGKIGLLGTVVLFAGMAGPAAAAVQANTDQLLAQVLADCDRTTGLPPGMTRPPLPGPDGKVVINPSWLHAAEAKDIGMVYPVRASNARISGKATISCQVAADGHPHDCAVVAETPAGEAFGAAAIKLSQIFRFVPKRVNCEPVDGAVVTIPIDFNWR